MDSEDIDEYEPSKLKANHVIQKSTNLLKTAIY